MVVIRNRCRVNFRDATLLRTNGSGEIAEVVDGERNIGCKCFADRLAVVPGFDGRQHLEIFFHALRDQVQHIAARRGRGLAPRSLRSMCGVECAIDISSIRAGDLAQNFSCDGRYIFEIGAGGGRDPLAADVVVILLADGDRKAVPSWTDC